MKTYHSSEKWDKYYIYFYWGVLNKFNLSLKEGALVSLIAVLSIKKGYCFASKKFLGDRLKLSPPTVFKGLSILIEKGLIIKDGKSGSGVVCLRPTPMFKQYIETLKGIDIYN